MKPSPFSIITGIARTNISRCQKKSLLLFHRLFQCLFQKNSIHHGYRLYAESQYPIVVVE